MSHHKFKQSLLFIIQASVIAVLIGYSRYLLTPTTTWLRSWDLVIMSWLCGTIIWLNSSKLQSVGSRILLMSSGALLLYAHLVYLNFFLIKQTVLVNSPQELQTVGAHLIVGYRSYDEIERLVKKQAVGGIFITKRNIRFKTKEQVKQEIAHLQAIRYQQGLPPLLVATDQEGGMVSRLTPLVEYQPPLATLISSSDHLTDTEKKAIQTYALAQAQQLRELGINLNFAPVVDLKSSDEQIAVDDLYSRIPVRALSSHPQIVTEAGLLYSQTLWSQGVLPTLKHFPGLGRTQIDTHLKEAKIYDTDDWSAHDWVPFREISQQTPVAIMLSHAHLMMYDTQYPTSFSSNIIHDLLRQNWNYQGLLVTDDFSMSPVYYSEQGVGQAAVMSLNAGNDLILIAYDTDLYYPVMMELLAAQKAGTLDENQLKLSQFRLQKIMNSLHNSNY